MDGYLILFVLAAAVLLAIILSLFNLKEAAVWVVTEVEKALGGGTGALKLEMAYNLLVQRWGWLGKIVPYPMVKMIIEKALAAAKELWVGNKAIQGYIDSNMPKVPTGAKIKQTETL